VTLVRAYLYVSENGGLKVLSAHLALSNYCILGLAAFIGTVFRDVRA
jgi:hypothetical protein